MCRGIKVGEGIFALVDDEDYSELNQYRWHAHFEKDIKSCYAERKILIGNGKYKTISMHRTIMNTPRGTQTDHKNHDTLDNRKENLRLCTQSQNGMNQKHHKKTFSSKYKGVYLQKGKYWVAYITIKGKRIHLGDFKSELQAAYAYNQAAKELFGEFALLNDIDSKKLSELQITYIGNEKEVDGNMCKYKTLQVKLTPVEYIGLKQIMHKQGFKSWKDWLCSMDA